jgi:hypothetical protein
VRCGRRLRRSLPVALCVACAVSVSPAPAARAVLIDSGDGTGNTSAPPDDFGWDYVGRRGGLTAVYLGDGWVLTANHVASGPVVIEGVSYEMIASTSVRLDNGDGTYADLKVVGLAGVPPLPPLPIRSAPLSSGTPVVMVGNGRDRGASTVPCDPNGPPPPGPLGGYEWLTTKTLRWGTNEIDGLLAFDDPSNSLNTEVFFTSFDQGATPDEAQATTGDSGGAIFIDNGSEWELAGIMIAVDYYPACQTLPLATSLYTNRTFAADLSFYRNQIEDIVALPEPDAPTGLACGVALLALLARGRRRRPGGPR